MATYPSFTEDGDPLIYHRLTGLAAQMAPNKAGQGDAAYLARTTTRLVPWESRTDPDDPDEPAELYGLDPLDVAAGDGGAVFFTPGKPVNVQWVKKSIHTAPGLAFRLSDLQALGQVTVRPTDLQTYYHRVFAADLSAGDDVVRRDLNVYDQLDAYSPLSDALSLIRTEIEETNAREAVLAVLRNRADNYNRPANGSLDTADFKRRLDQAVDGMLDFVQNWVPMDTPMDEWDQKVLETYSDELSRTLVDAIYSGASVWANPHISREAEVCVWAEVPCELAVLAFDGNGFDWLESYGMLRGAPTRLVAGRR